MSGAHTAAPKVRSNFAAKTPRSLPTVLNATRISRLKFGMGKSLVFANPKFEDCGDKYVDDWFLMLGNGSHQTDTTDLFDWVFDEFSIAPSAWESVN